MTDATPRVYLVDDDPAIREAVSMLLRSQGFPVETHAEAGAFLAATGPDSRGCAVIDLRMPGMDGLQLQAEMARRGMTLATVFLTAFGDIPTTVQAMQAGAVDFLTKPVTGSQLAGAIAAALVREQAQYTQARRNHHAATLITRLTEREIAVMGLLLEGKSNKEVGRALNISHRTVEIHKAHIMEKLGAGTLMDLARIAREAGIRD